MFLLVQGDPAFILCLTPLLLFWKFGDENALNSMIFFLSLGSCFFLTDFNVVETARRQAEPITKEIERFRQLQNRVRLDDLVLRGLPVRSEQVPVVHPRLIRTKFYEGEAALKNENLSTASETLEMTYEDEVCFDDILGQTDEAFKYLALIGYPGSGKTTLAKRLAKSEVILCFQLNFMNLNFGDLKLTLRQLLLEYSYPDLHDQEDRCSNIFKWVVNNQNKVAIIIDGYDQSEWTLNPKSPSLDYKTPQKVEDLVSNLCRKHYLRDVHLIITSRPHSVMTMPEILRPKITLFVRDLKFEDMKRLFFAFAQGQAQEIWNKINTGARQLLGFCLNPMMLQFCVQAFLIRGSNPDGAREITTLTQIFATVIKNISSIDNIMNKNIDTIMKQLSAIGFDATMASTVLITKEQLTKENLTVEEVQDLIIAVRGYFGYTSRIFDGTTKLYFSHQSLQEYFTAYQMVEELSFSKFINVLEDRLFTPQWSMVRKFVSGLLLDLPSKGMQ